MLIPKYRQLSSNYNSQNSKNAIWNGFTYHSVILGKNPTLVWIDNAMCEADWINETTLRM